MSDDTGWQTPRELGPQPGINLIDRMCSNADQRERAQAQAPDAMAQMMLMMQMQSQQIDMLTKIVTKMLDAHKEGKS